MPSAPALVGTWRAVAAAAAAVAGDKGRGVQGGDGVEGWMGWLCCEEVYAPGRGAGVCLPGGEGCDAASVMPREAPQGQPCPEHAKVHR